MSMYDVITRRRGFNSLLTFLYSLFSGPILTVAKSDRAVWMLSNKAFFSASAALSFASTAACSAFSFAAWAALALAAAAFAYAKKIVKKGKKKS